MRIHAWFENGHIPVRCFKDLDVFSEVKNAGLSFKNLEPQVEWFFADVFTGRIS
jgi:hypothetical protein